MKKFLSIVLAFGILTIVGCSGNNPSSITETTLPDSTNLQTQMAEISSQPTTAPTSSVSTQGTLGIDEPSSDDYYVKSIDLLQREYSLANAKKIYGDNFKVTSTLADENSIEFFSSLINGDEHFNDPPGNWPKYNPARANEYAIKIFFNDGSVTIINLHYTNQSQNYYIAIANCKEDTEYNSFVMSDNADKLFTKHEIEKEYAEKLIKFFE